MVTALDSSVLWAIIRKEPGHEKWLKALLDAASKVPLIISPIAFAELARISHTFRREAQREPCSGKEGADFCGGLCENTLPTAKIKSDAANAWLPRAAADKCETFGLAPSTTDEASLTAFLGQLSIAYSPIAPAAVHLAGLIFKHYRQAGGPRQYLVPDFVIAAHAQTQANRIAVIDRGYLRKGFPHLTLLTP
jgi:predicted nucleic acid-binding protein